MTPIPPQPDVLIIGAGPSGSAAAAMLAQAGLDVVVIEKSTFPRFAIGESLLPQCMDLLEEAGLLETVEAQGYQVKKGALFRRGDKACVINFSEQFHDGFDYTYQVPRAHFDHTLAKQAEAYGATFCYGHGVTAADFSGDSGDSGERPVLTMEDPDGQTHTCEPRFVLDASGNAHVLARLLGLVKKTDLRLRSACFAHLEKDPGDPEFSKDYILVNINQVDPAVWYWAIPFSNNRTSFGLVAEPDFMQTLPQDPHERIHAALATDPGLQTRFIDSTIDSPPGYMSGYSHAVSRMTGEHFAILGNAGGFLDPVFSSGVTIALKSAVLASNLLIQQFKGNVVDWQADFSDELNHGVEAFKTYVNAWYDGSFQTILFSEEKEPHCSAMVCSILAGYVWDRQNSLAVRHQRGLELLTEICSAHS